ncbi:DgyrCDS4050 [Dimorphilus gyrociliatus]|uniref:DgyrCDS4050 n=1 Tax=Dimorphilus gyrociliatus TaxID=2664684 RepID=A0A7I8VFR8_9ANNE|nr:DgyrCDS4050 [Dimorphilus gyrociliatus]
MLIARNWGSWGSCSATCGSSTRYRSCQTGLGFGSKCSSGSTDSSSCSVPSCPVNGAWSSWGSWGVCSKTCGSGIKTAARSCNNPSPAHGGSTCSGSSSKDAGCTITQCPVNGGWSAWGSWGGCSKTCGLGSKSATRSCNNPSPAHGGSSCSGSASKNTDCTVVSCPVNGGWSVWGSWGACSKSCKGGIQNRTRTCNNPTPAHGGAECTGDIQSQQECNTQKCPAI